MTASGDAGLKAVLFTSIGESTGCWAGKQRCDNDILIGRIGIVLLPHGVTTLPGATPSHIVRVHPMLLGCCRKPTRIFCWLHCRVLQRTFTMMWVTRKSLNSSCRCVLYFFLSLLTISCICFFFLLVAPPQWRLHLIDSYLSC